jgi:tRNA-splicing ligase RtcB
MTAGLECRKDAEVIDETPAATSPSTQTDLVDIVHMLRQVICVKS